MPRATQIQTLQKKRLHLLIKIWQFRPRGFYKTIKIFSESSKKHKCLGDRTFNQRCDFFIIGNILSTVRDFRLTQIYLGENTRFGEANQSHSGGVATPPHLLVFKVAKGIGENRGDVFLKMPVSLQLLPQSCNRVKWRYLPVLAVQLDRRSRH